MLEFTDELKQRPIAFLKFSDELWKLREFAKRCSIYEYSQIL
jgi:hypothetical protein